MHIVKKNKQLGAKKKLIFILRLFLCILIFYAIFCVANQQIQINSKKKELEVLQTKVIAQQQENQKLKQNLEQSSEEQKKYIEKKARESLGFAKKDERIFENIGGK